MKSAPNCMFAAHRILLLLLLSTTVTYGQDKPSVVATASMIADMTKAIGGEFIHLTCIVPIGGDPHVYEPTPSDARTVAEADLIFRNGLTFEGWLNELIENSGTKAQVITVTDGITPIASDIYQNAVDPHAWMDASKGLTYVDNILASLQKLLPDHKQALANNHQQYRRELEELDEYIAQQIQSIPQERRILITSHDAFQYYGRRYGLRLESVLGTSTDADVQTSDVMRLTKVISDSKIPALFIESTINPKLLQQLAKDNDIRIGGNLYADSIGDQDSPAPSYLAMLKYNTDVIVQALSRQIIEPVDGTTSGSSESRYLYLLIGAILLAVAIFSYFKFAS